MKHFYQGARDFLLRYGVVFKSAWAARSQLEPTRRTSEELEFLPAHLELTDTPVSPIPRWTMRVIIAFFVTALLWACFGTLDIVAVAPGKVVVSSRTKLVQPAETAVVRRILVRDGQRVKKGEVLVELDATSSGAELTQASEARIGAHLTALRLEALAAAIGSGTPPELPHQIGIPPHRLKAEQMLATTQFEGYQARKSVLSATIAQRLAELRTLQASIEPLEEIAQIATTRAQDYASLMEGQFVGRHDYLMREQERITAQRQLASQRELLRETRAAITTARAELSAMIASIRGESLDGSREARTQLAHLTSQVDKAEQRDRQMALRAPVNGTAQQLAIHTVGGVVTPAQPLLAIVPTNEELEAEVKILNKDIGFVLPGQEVAIKVDSFPYTRYGDLNGLVLSISQDAAQDDNLGLTFPARVRILDAGGDTTPIRLTAGMSLSVEIKTGKRRIIDYLISPLRKHASEAMRER